MINRKYEPRDRQREKATKREHGHTTSTSIKQQKPRGSLKSINQSIIWSCSYGHNQLIHDYSFRVLERIYIFIIVCVLHTQKVLRNRLFFEKQLFKKPFPYYKVEYRSYTKMNKQKLSETTLRVYRDDLEQIKLIQKRESLASIEDALHWIMKRLANLEELYDIVQGKCDDTKEELDELRVEYISSTPISLFLLTLCIIRQPHTL